MKIPHYEVDVFSIKNTDGVLTQQPHLRDGVIFTAFTHLPVQKNIFAVNVWDNMHILTSLKIEDDKYKVLVYNKSKNKFKITNIRKIPDGYEFVATVLQVLNNPRLSQ